MKKLGIRLTFLLFISGMLFFFSCEDEKIEEPIEIQYKNKFLEETVYGVYKQGETVLQFDKITHQLAYSKKGIFFRIQTDDQAVYFHCRFAERPAEGMQEVEIDVKSLPDIEPGDYKMELIKSTLSHVWLWDMENCLGVIAKVE